MTTPLSARIGAVLQGEESEENERGDTRGGRERQVGLHVCGYEQDFGHCCQEDYQGRKYKHPEPGKEVVGR
ncbi:hypothetical protein [Pseudomonas sp. S3_F07]